MLYAINYTEDIGYDWKKHNCVVCADSEEDAKKMLADWAGKNLPGERYIIDGFTKVTPLSTDNNGVIWNDWSYV